MIIGRVKRKLFPCLLAITVMFGCGGGPSNSTQPPPPPPPSPDFSLAASAVSVEQGSTGNASVTVNPLHGFTGMVNMAFSSSQTGITAASIQVAAGNTGTLAVSVGASVPAATYNATVTGTSGSLSHTATLQVTVTAQPLADFSLSESSSSITLAAGNTLQMQVTLQAVGRGSTNFTVNLALSMLPQGVTGSFAQASLTPGQSSMVALTAAIEAPAANVTVTVTGTRASDVVVRTTAFTLNVTPRPTVGGGTLSYNIDPACPSSVHDFLVTSQTVQHAACGMAADSSTVNVVLDRSISGASFHFGTSPTMTFGSLPGDNGTDPTQWWYLPTWANANALLNGATLPPFGFNPLGGMGSGFVNACTKLSDGRLRQIGVAVNGPDFAFVTQTVDTVRTWRPEMISGTNLYESLGEAAYIMQAAATTPSGTQSGDWSKYSFAPATNCLWQKYTDKQAPLTRDELAATFDCGGARIDNQAASAWMGAVPFFVDGNEVLQPGVYLNSITAYSPINPTQIIAITVSAQQSAGGVLTSLLTVPVTHHVFDVNGNEVITVNATTGAYVDVPALKSLSYGAYTLITTATINSTPYTSTPSVFAVVDPKYLPIDSTYSGTSPGLFFITVDANGYAVNSTITVIDGHLVAQWPGLAIIDAVDPTAMPATVTVSVNGGQLQTYTVPRPYTRVIPVK